MGGSQHSALEYYFNPVKIIGISERSSLIDKENHQTNQERSDSINRKRYRIVVLGLSAVFLVLLLSRPELSLKPLWAAESQPFKWDRAEMFKALERDFQTARDLPPETIAQEITNLETEGHGIFLWFEKSGNNVPFKQLSRLEAIQFQMAAFASAHESLLPRLQDFINDARVRVMRAAQTWPVNQRDVHEAIYRVIYGGRTAIEEAMVQNSPGSLPSLIAIEDVPSATPSTLVQGVQVHSGDIVLSRGGAPTSALIARGNDFPGNFSHAALIHVDPETGIPTVIESLIEKGAVLTTLEEYLEYKSLRILLLRLQPEHPILIKNPQAPHKAASFMLSRVRKKHISYDFTLDWRDPTRFFCSEVPYHAFRSVGIDLWAYQSTISSPGLKDWLGALGARHFVTIVPTDLEYDPRLGAVAEWRNPETLRQDRFDNVTMDALLEGAEKGDRLTYTWYKLPVATIVKGWSLFQSLLGATPKIPNGMSASTALTVDGLMNRIHPLLRSDIQESAARFKESNGYEAPYWILMDIARKALINRYADLSAELKTSSE